MLVRCAKAEPSKDKQVTPISKDLNAMRNANAENIRVVSFDAVAVLA
jgi:hypothetical protein